MTPQWMTQQRLAKLDELARRDGYLCLKEHPNCLEITHYQWAIPHQEAVAVPVQHPVLDKATGGIRRDITRPGWASEQMPVWEWLPVNHLADATCAEAIASWQAEDREERALDWKREQQSILDGTYGAFGGFSKLGRDGQLQQPFDPVARDVFMAERPEYYLKGTGVDGMHGRPIAVVRVPSQNIYLYVDVSAAFVQPTKSQRRNGRRRGKPVSEVIRVEGLCQQAIRLWWAKRS